MFELRLFQDMREDTKSRILSRVPTIGDQSRLAHWPHRRNAEDPGDGAGHPNSTEEFGVAALVLPLSVGYFLIGRTPMKGEQGRGFGILNTIP